MYVYVCVYVCNHVCTHVCMQAFYTFLCTYVPMNCLCIYVSLYICVCVCTCMITPVRRHRYTDFLCIHKYIHTRPCRPTYAKDSKVYLSLHMYVHVSFLCMCVQNKKAGRHRWMNGGRVDVLEGWRGRVVGK